MSERIDNGMIPSDARYESGPRHLECQECGESVPWEATGSCDGCCRRLCRRCLTRGDDGRRWCEDCVDGLDKLEDYDEEDDE